MMIESQVKDHRSAIGDRRSVSGFDSDPEEPAPRRAGAHGSAAQRRPEAESVFGPPVIRIALLTGGGDKPYAIGMATALTSAVYD